MITIDNSVCIDVEDICTAFVIADSVDQAQLINLISEAFKEWEACQQEQQIFYIAEALNKSGREWIINLADFVKEL